MSRPLQISGYVVVFLLAIAISPVALALGALWLAWRAALYVTAKSAAGDITGWTGEGSPDAIEAAVAFPHLKFADEDGNEHVFTSRIGYNIYDDAPPAKALPIRYHLRPRFHAEIDDRGHWFTGPCVVMGLALLGSFFAWAGRYIMFLWAIR